MAASVVQQPLQQLMGSVMTQIPRQSSSLVAGSAPTSLQLRFPAAANVPSYTLTIHVPQMQTVVARHNADSTSYKSGTVACQQVRTWILGAEEVQAPRLIQGAISLVAVMLVPQAQPHVLDVCAHIVSWQPSNPGY